MQSHAAAICVSSQLSFDAVETFQYKDVKSVLHSAIFSIKLSYHNILKYCSICKLSLYHGILDEL